MEDLVMSFIESCPKAPLMTDEEIQAEVNAVRYEKRKTSVKCECDL